MRTNVTDTPVFQAMLRDDFMDLVDLMPLLHIFCTHAPAVLIYILTVLGRSNVAFICLNADVNTIPIFSSSARLVAMAGL